MKTSICFVLASALLAPAALAASFEGKVSFKMTSDRGQSQEMHYNIKGDKIRLEMPGQKGMGMIVDSTKKEMTTIMDEQKMYMTMQMPDTAVQAMEKKGDDVTLEKTGETEKILGYTAVKYIATTADGKSELWLAEGLGSFMSMSNGSPMGRRGGAAPQAQAWERALAGKDLFPLRVAGKDKAGKETFRMDVTAIEKKTLPDSMFTPPAGYQKLDMGMLKGMVPGAR